MPKEIAEEKKEEQETEGGQAPIPPPASFPWGMLCVAAGFDLIGLIPGINIITEIIGGFIIGFWQKIYAPQTDPLISFFVAKIFDVLSLGLLPSNIGVVVFAYVKKLAARKAALAKFKKPKAERLQVARAPKSPAPRQAPVQAV